MLSTRFASMSGLTSKHLLILTRGSWYFMVLLQDPIKKCMPATGPWTWSTTQMHPSPASTGMSRSLTPRATATASVTGTGTKTVGNATGGGADAIRLVTLASYGARGAKMASRKNVTGGHSY